MSIPAKVGEVVPLVLVTPDGNTTVYPQAEVYAAGGTVPLATIDLDHKAKGRYEGEWTPTSAGAYTAHFIVYADAGHSVEYIRYTREAEQIFATTSDVDDLASEIVRLLGLNLENTFIDNCTYDPNDMLTAGRLRVFDTKANAQAATEGGVGEAGELAEYTVESVHYGPNRLRTMRMVKQ